jgi:glycine cleavage system H protein
MSEYLETMIDKFVFRVAKNRLYSPEGVWALWIESQGEGLVRIGITDYQQQLNGDVAFVHLKEVGTKLAAGDEFAEMETIKATVSFSSPISGTLVEVNFELDLSPEVVNQDPYGKGWMAVIKTADWETDRKKLLDAPSYFSSMRSQAEEELKKS